jgi:nucleotide-binding universal stress UspA family protein
MTKAEIDGRRILVTSDLSAGCTQAFVPAARLARALGLPLTLLHVVIDAKARPAPDGQWTASQREVARERESAQRELSAQTGAFGGGVEVMAEAVVAPELVAAILERAARLRAPAIVMSTHGRGGLRHLVLGSVTEAVVRAARIPVVCCPERGAARRRL